MVKSRREHTPNINTRISPSGDSMVEHCLNPWNGECRSTDIAVYIIYRGERVPLCWKCWREISRKNIVWEA